MVRAVVLAAALVAAAFAISYCFATRDRGAETVLLTYRRTGGLAGVSEEVVIYGDGRLTVGGGGLSAGSKLPSELISALREVLKRIREGGVRGPEPAPGAADYFTHWVESPALGVNVSWVDPWAAGGEVPDEIAVLDRLLSFARAYTLGWESQPAASLSRGGLTLEVWVDRPWITPGGQVTVSVRVENVGGEPVAYRRPTPCHPDLSIEVEGGGADVAYVRPAYDPTRPCVQVISEREIPPGGSVENSAVVTLSGTSDWVLWVRVSFPYPPNDPLTVRLPIVVVG